MWRAARNERCSRTSSRGVGRVVAVDELIDTLWPTDPPRTAAKSLQTYVLRIRNTLEPDRQGVPRLILTDGPGYRLAAPEDTVDAHRFARLVEQARHALAEGRADAASATLDEALRLWRGPAYAGFEHTGFGAAESRRLEELRRLAIEERLAADLDLGRAPEAAAELESLVREHPLRERLWGLLMIALVRAGRQADALAAYGQARSVLAEKLGIDPGADLRRVHARVLAQDPALLTPRRATAVPEPLLHRPGPFVGREAELATLRAAWRKAASGTSAIIVLRGPTGSGRTRLAAELAVEVAESGAVVEYGQSMPAEPATTATLSITTGASADQHAAGRRLGLVIADRDTTQVTGRRHQTRMPRSIGPGSGPGRDASEAACEAPTSVVRASVFAMPVVLLSR